MIINVPIEPIEMRYSIEWDKWFRESLSKEVVYGTAITEGIEQGKFLDVYGTNYYKSTQLANIISMLHKGVIKDGDILCFHDLWFPGIEQLFYIRDALDKKFFITGCLHAGAYDPNDFLYQQGMGNWAVHFEHCLLQGVDQIYVATNYHKELIQKNRATRDNIFVTGFPIKYAGNVQKKREPIVVFPHRLDEEKHPEIFDSIKVIFNRDDWKWIKTAEFNDKAKYYEVLHKATVAVSFATQETWGIAMQEAVLRGCIPVVPDTLSYKEMYNPEFKYKNVFDSMCLIEKFMENPPDIHNQTKKIVESGMFAIQNMKECMRGLIC